MARRIPTLELEPILVALGEDGATDEVDAALLDATRELLTTVGLKRWSIDDVAEVAGIGRTTVYRRFESRDRLVHATLAREIRTFFLTIAEAVAAVEPVEERVVEGMLLGIGMARQSVFVQLVERDPQTFLPFLTTNAGPLVAASRDLLVEMAVRADAGADRTSAALVAETLVRLAMSFVVTPESVFAFDDPDTARPTLRALVHALLGATVDPAG